MEELRPALTEALTCYEPGDAKYAELEDEPGFITEYRVMRGPPEFALGPAGDGRPARS
jgi:hypothetical protein